MLLDGVDPSKNKAASYYTGIFKGIVLPFL